MKICQKGCLAAFLLFFILFSKWQTFAQNPGTIEDPLVTKSYIDQFFKFRMVVIPSGEKISLTSGCMFVLRSGRLKLRAPKEKQLIDLTEGKTLPPDTFIPANHLILVPDSGGYFLEAQNLCTILAIGIHPKK